MTAGASHISVLMVSKHVQTVRDDVRVTTVMCEISQCLCALALTCTVPLLSYEQHHCGCLCHAVIAIGCFQVLPRFRFSTTCAAYASHPQPRESLHRFVTRHVDIFLHSTVIRSSRLVSKNQPYQAMV